MALQGVVGCLLYTSFEGMWPLPYGVSYNSYLIDDEMVALVDTVDICYFEVYLRKIKQVIGRCV